MSKTASRQGGGLTKRIAEVAGDRGGVEGRGRLMATAAMRKTKLGNRARVRPEDGGVVWHEKFNAFECEGCGEYTEIRDRSKRTPDKLAEMREFLVIDHTECWEFDDPKMAADARKYRSERKRRDNLKSRASGALNRQEVSWRGR